MAPTFRNTVLRGDSFSVLHTLPDGIVQTIGWQPSCACGGEIVPCVVLDPFAGSGTTLATAKWLRRDYLGVELNPDYAKLIEERLRPAEGHESQRSGFDMRMTLDGD